MDQEELLRLYVEKLHLLAQERLQERNMSVIEALQDALTYLEGEMQGY